MPNRRLSIVFACIFAAGIMPASSDWASAQSPFDQWDRDGDGRVSREEMPLRIRANFDRADTDQDGYLSKAEDAAFRRRASASREQVLTRRDRVVIHTDLVYVDEGHERQSLDLLVPEQPAADRLPLLVWIHGGAWRAGSKESGYGRLLPYVASGEYLGASINYRLSQHATWPAQLHDCKAAIRWLRANADTYGIDPPRIAVWGASAGGHLTLAVALMDGAEHEGAVGGHFDQPSDVVCGVDFFGPSHLLTMNAADGRMDHDAPDSPESMLIGGAIQENKRLADAASPIHFVDEDDPPLLIAHGTDDLTVPVGQSEEITEALRKAGVPVHFIRVVGGGHGFRSEALDKRIRAFFAKHLRGIDAEISSEPVKAE